MIQLELTDLAYGGDAVGRHQGLAIFVPGGIAGETVEVEVVEERRGYARARLVKLLKPSPDRVTPPYPELGESGGFQWQHIAYNAQLQWKTHIVRELLARIGRFRDPQVELTIGMPDGSDIWKYRTVAQFSVGHDGAVGFNRVSSHDVLDMPDCPIVHPFLNEIYIKTREWILKKWGKGADEFIGRFTIRVASVASPDATSTKSSQGQAMLTVEARNLNQPDAQENWRHYGEEIMATIPALAGIVILHAPGERGHVILGQDYIIDQILGKRFRISAESFFQVNGAQTPVLVEKVITALQPQHRDAILDGYSGVGLFTMFIAPRVSRMAAIESQPSAVADARANVAMNNLSGISIIEGTVERVLGKLIYNGQRFDGVLLDPPRAGCHPKALQSILNMKPRVIVYVSCDPSTLARDLAILSGGGYRLTSAQPIDMFPQTSHIETIAVLKRAANI